MNFRKLCVGAIAILIVFSMLLTLVPSFFILFDRNNSDEYSIPVEEETSVVSEDAQKDTIEK